MGFFLDMGAEPRPLHQSMHTAIYIKKNVNIEYLLQRDNLVTWDKLNHLNKTVADGR
jgi:hypothetical protein